MKRMLLVLLVILSGCGSASKSEPTTTTTTPQTSVTYRGVNAAVPEGWRVVDMSDRTCPPLEGNVFIVGRPGRDGVCAAIATMQPQIWITDAYYCGYAQDCAAPVPVKETDVLGALRGEINTEDGYVRYLIPVSGDDTSGAVSLSFAHVDDSVVAAVTLSLRKS